MVRWAPDSCQNADVRLQKGALYHVLEVGKAGWLCLCEPMTFG